MVMALAPWAVGPGMVTAGVSTTMGGSASGLAARLAARPCWIKPMHMRVKPMHMRVKLMHMRVKLMHMRVKLMRVKLMRVKPAPMLSEGRVAAGSDRLPRGVSE